MKEFSDANDKQAAVIQYVMNTAGDIIQDRLCVLFLAVMKAGIDFNFSFLKKDKSVLKELQENVFKTLFFENDDLATSSVFYSLPHGFLTYYRARFA